MTDPLTLEMEMRQKLAEAEGKIASLPKEIPIAGLAYEEMSDFWYARGVQDTIELLLPDVISWRKVREWLKDWALSIPLDDLEAVISGVEQK